MGSIARRTTVGTLAALSLLLCSGSARHPNYGVAPPGWPGFAYNSQHWAKPNVAAQPLVHIKWSAPVDLSSGGIAHYGTPIISRANTVVFPVRLAGGAYRIEARRATDGVVVWTLNTGFVPPQSGWVPTCGPTLTPVGAVAIPDSGGRILRRNSADAATSATQSLVFFGAANYAANPSAYNTAVRINTPLTCDPSGNLYFGFAVNGSTPLNLKSGIARIAPDGQGSWVAASVAANDATISRLQHNCAPALGLTGTTLYFTVRDSGGAGYLLCLDSRTLTLLHKVRLKDPKTGQDADITDFSTASPTIGPDGQVFIGVLDDGLNNNDRGWLLHFNATLTQTLAPGAFGWDNTVAIIPASSVGLYSGSSPYLLFSKYNNYAGIGTGNGLNMIAVLDPNATQIDPISGLTILKEVITKVGPTLDPPAGPGAVREWCINTAAVDWIGHSGMVNNEDGKVYRWNFDTNTLSETVTLTPGTSEAYTPTVIGPDGTVYAINAAKLFAVGQ